MGLLRDLTPFQHEILNTLAEIKVPLRLGDLCRRLRERRSYSSVISSFVSTSKTLKTLEERGLISKIKVGHRVYWSLTPRGLRFLYYSRLLDEILKIEGGDPRRISEMSSEEEGRDVPELKSGSAI